MASAPPTATETTNNRDDLPQLYTLTERAALLHDDNDYTFKVADSEGQPIVS